jgi:ABC-2 type transport system permease protein
MWERIKHILLKEFIQISRDKKMLSVIFFAPVFQLFILGYAVTTDINNISLAVLDYDKTSQSREFIALFTNSGYFQIKKFASSEKEISSLLDRGEVSSVLQINPNFGSNLKKGVPVEVQLIVDGTNSNTAMVVASYSTQIISQQSQKIMVERLIKKRGLNLLIQNKNFPPQIYGIDNRIIAWYNPTLKSVNYNVSAMLSIILMVATVMLTAQAIVREKEMGTMEQVLVTPIKPVELLLAKISPFVIIGFTDVLLVMTVALFWFKVPFRGNFLVLLFTVGLFLLTTLGIGLYISTISKTQQQALLSTFFIMMPMMILSGFMFPISNMPKIIQYFTYLIPLRYFLVIIRGIFLKGNGFDMLWKEMIPLAFLGISIFGLSVAKFQKRVK